MLYTQFDSVDLENIPSDNLYILTLGTLEINTYLHNNLVR